MMKSMTGFASVTREEPGASIGVTVRSVNHRYLDVQLRLPQSLSAIESRIRGVVQQRVARGRVEVAISIQLRQPPKLEIELNEAFAIALAAAMTRARAVGLIEGALQPGDIMRFPQALTVREQAAELDAAAAAAIEAGILGAVEQALQELDVMRSREGALLQQDLDARRTSVAAQMQRVAELAQAGEHTLSDRLGARIAELTAELAVDRGAIAQEIVRFVSRSDISEELVRFRAHVTQWTSLSDGPEPCGRKLDFLLQEMNREVNTTGSKADGEGISERIIAIKAELEKMREQVQNVE
ncbi:MAG: YicC family protein [Acidobacteria bacterium]|nr:YicC family protein [Acidobacteriota bacterium]